MWRDLATGLCRRQKECRKAHYVPWPHFNLCWIFNLTFPYAVGHTYSQKGLILWLPVTYDLDPPGFFNCAFPRPGTYSQQGRSGRLLCCGTFLTNCKLYSVLVGLQGLDTQMCWPQTCVSCCFPFLICTSSYVLRALSSVHSRASTCESAC